MSLLTSLKSYAIALPERAQRIETELATQGVSVNIVPAIDKRTAALPPNWTGNGKDFGCTCSWLELLDFASQTNDYFIAYEDDFVFRYDTLKYLPAWEELKKFEFDCVYLTGHYGKGATRAEPRRIPWGKNLVQAYGIHTLPARIISADFAKVLRDRIHAAVHSLGYGADRVDAIVCGERRRTFALEAHIGGQRQADRRSWEPRLNEFKFKYAASLIHAYPPEDGKDLEETLALVAFCSRFDRMVALNCSLRNISCIAEAATDIGGKVLAINHPSHQKSMLSRTDDRLNKYRTYGIVELLDFQSADSTLKPKCLVVEFGRGEDPDRLFDMVKTVADSMEGGAVIVVICSEKLDFSNVLNRLKVHDVTRFHGLSKRIAFGSMRHLDVKQLSC